MSSLENWRTTLVLWAPEVFLLVDPGGIEPPSRKNSTRAFTRVGGVLISAFVTGAAALHSAIFRFVSRQPFPGRFRLPNRLLTSPRKYRCRYARRRSYAAILIWLLPVTVVASF